MNREVAAGSSHSEVLTFEEGMTSRVVLGAFFIGFLMLPGAIYMGLIAGSSMGPAAEWVTVILFAELARRSFAPLRRQEIYVLYYIAGGLTHAMAGVMLAGGPFGSLIWHQYLAQSQVAQTLGLAGQIPSWVAPAAGSEALRLRTFIHEDWVKPIVLLVAGQVLARAEWFGLGYVLFRVTSDIERLPFPLAPVAAQGATALAESGEPGRESWRWRVFASGMGMGLLFGAVYVGLPALSGLIASRPLELLPIPWIDYTRDLETILPATAVGIGTDIGLVFLGFVLPFWVVTGAFSAAVVQIVANPLLHGLGVLERWRPGMDAVTTHFVNDLDVWLSVYLGTAAAVALAGIYTALGALRSRKSGPVEEVPEGRGDFPIVIGLGLYGVAALAYSVLCVWLLEDDEFPLVFLLVFAFVLTPAISYVNARMVALTGHSVGIPLVREGALMLSGYRGMDIWFAPIPFHDHGRRAQLFREMELTGTPISSIAKAELLILPVMLGCGFLFWSLIWEMSPIPSAAFPFAQKYWHLIALRQFMWFSFTLEGGLDVSDVLHLPWAAGGFAVAGAGLWITTAMGLPAALVYGFVSGLQGLPHLLLPQMFGALLARFHLQRRFGTQRWRRWAPVLLAGYACGQGLVGMGSVAVVLISRSVAQLPY
ncbi:MAG: peptide transporter [Candidatus Latescibacterota bacterium]|nr:peptide transporter [Candidatus Latescibacterota bacterium]